MTRVLVAMSGGVDSSLTAALLKEQGMLVEGVTMKLTAGVCCDIASAQAVCSHLGIPHRLIDAQQEFSDRVIDDFVSEYRRGCTPNPCIRCNDLVKFHLLLGHARSAGFDYLATGHYARIDRDNTSGLFVLSRGADANKDQSYFLYRLNQDQMAHVLFPLGRLQKDDVRRMARERGIPAAERPESQEVCFVPADDYRSFLKERAPETLQPGDLVMRDGTVVGRHEGIAFFTVGQRRKLGVAAGERLYVLGIDAGTNRVVLGRKTDLETGEMVVSDVRMTSGRPLAGRVAVTVKIRYRSPFAPALIEPTGSGMVRVAFTMPVSGVCPGQAAVFYRHDAVLGGGIIASAR